MGVISLVHMDQLYWLGRYTERVYSTIRLFAERYDSMIDISESEYREFLKSQDIPDIYKDKNDFMRRYCFDRQDPNSIISNLTRAYDNAIVLREEIGSETLSYIQLAVYQLNHAEASQSTLIELQKVCDYIMAFWGMEDDHIQSDDVRNIIKFGKRIERIDIYSRIGKPREVIKKEVKRMNSRLKSTSLEYDHEKLGHINYIIEVDPFDHKAMISDIESLVSV